MQNQFRGIFEVQFFLDAVAEGIDVVEIKGTAPATITSSLHSGSDEGGSYTFTGGDSSTNFHNYLLEWEPNSISFSVDGHLYETQTSWGTSISGATYPTPFNAPFFILMNLAVGGQLRW